MSATDDARESAVESRILVSVLNWNSTAHTLFCLSHLLVTGHPRVDCIVLDNGSDVDVTTALKQSFPGVEVLRNPRNAGFTGGHNIVVALALERGYGSILLLNNDCKIDMQSVIAMQELMDRSQVVVAVSPLIYSDGPSRKPQAVGGWLDWASHQSVYPSTPATPQPSAYPTHAPATALLLRCDALRDLGPLDDRYFAYYEDNDLSARIASRGLKVAYCDAATALHRSRAINEYSALALYLSARNAWLFWSTHTPIPFKRGMWRHLVGQHLREIARLKRHGGSLEQQWAVVNGFWDALHRRFGPPPLEPLSPWLLRKLALKAPYFLSSLLTDPGKAIGDRLRDRARVR